MKKNKRKKKVFLSCRDIRRTEFQRAVTERYSTVVFTASLEDADYCLFVIEKDGLSTKQSGELKDAIDRGISQLMVQDHDLLNPADGNLLRFDREMEPEYEEYAGKGELGSHSNKEEILEMM